MKYGKIELSSALFCNEHDMEYTTYESYRLVYRLKKQNVH